MIHATIGDVDLRFETAPSLFSPGAIDKGTAAMLEHAEIGAGDKVLDLGCGYGPVGIYAAAIGDPSRVWLTDNDPLAVDYARRNLKLNAVEGATVLLSNGFLDLRETAFTKILCNPPYHADFSVAKHLIEKGFNRLTMGGSMWMVTKRSVWYASKLRSIFGGVRVTETNGYFIFEAIRKSASYARRS
jgi:16S rRNA (guanine1207-N2)-methyltransferase